MGVKQRANNVKYVKIKEGKFILYNDDNIYDELEGLITRIEIGSTDYKGVVSETLNIDIESDGTIYRFSTYLDSGYSRSLLAFLSSADLSKPLSLVPSLKDNVRDGNVYKQYSVFVQQDGKYMKNGFNKDEVPPYKKVILNGKQMIDKTDMLIWLKTKLIPSLQGALGVVTAPTSKEIITTNSDVDLPEVVNDFDDDDLPF